MKRIQIIAQYIIGLTVLVLGALYLPCVFQKGGVEDNIFVLLFGTTVLSSLVILVRKIEKSEIIFALFAAPVIVICGLIIQYLFVAIMYGEKTWFLWDTKGKLIANSLLFGAIGIALISIDIIRKRKE